MTVARPLLALGTALALAWTSQARADDFGVAARVNGAAIGLVRLERYFEENLQEKGRLVAGIRSPAAFKTMKKAALDELVDRELLWQEAQRRKRVVPQKDLDIAMARFRAQLPDPARRRLQLERGGFTEQGYTEYVKRELSIRRLVELDLAPKVKVTAAEVHAFYQANLDHFTGPEPEERDAIRARLGDEKLQQAMRELVAELRGKARVEILIPL